MRNKRPVLGIEINKPHMPHVAQASGSQRMGADAPTEIQHIPMGELLLQAQGVSDVISAAEVPGRQLQQVACSHRVLIEHLRMLGIEGTWMHGSQILLALRKTVFHLIR